MVLENFTMSTFVLDKLVPNFEHFKEVWTAVLDCNGTSNLIASDDLPTVNTKYGFFNH